MLDRTVQEPSTFPKVLTALLTFDLLLLIIVFLFVFFSKLDQTADLFSKQGFKVVENCYVQRQTVNKKECVTAERIFLQGKFEKLNVLKTNKDRNA